MLESLRETMNTILGNLGSGVKNPHIAIPVVLAILCEVGKIWMPDHANQWDSTQKVLMGYGLFAASNSGPKTPPST